MSRHPLVSPLFKGLLTAGILSLGTLATAQAREPLEVVTSFSILDDMVSTIGGDHVEVSSLVGPDGDAHTFSPSPSDARTLADADLVVVNGLQFEGWIDRLIDASGYDGDVVVASRGIEPLAFDGHHDEEPAGRPPADHDHNHDHDGHDHASAGHDHDDHDHANAGHDHDDHDHAEAGHHHHGNLDPHAWQDLANGEQYARNIRDALVKADPSHADDYRANAAHYIEQMKALDTEIRERLARIPEADRLIITSHDAFGYFAHAYGLELLAPVGLNTQAEPSAGDMAELIQQIEASHAKALFLENMSNPALVRQLQEETGVAIGGTLYADALTADGEGSTYLGMFRHNADTLVAALTAPGPQ
ncbi:MULTISPECIES: metal ABC transporter substrate-binding protein [unclassified Modicisalibacter]|uniref:metal ABC transporter substrate-binding protein n=1 Tax=unclassified Modicisalibacter TaxID=2679913 RepID=UPI001CCE5028|nr:MULTISPECIES: metal ABC transporter substrate-binding protein [unclassified Modicisalibacter]MBZ9558385.1 metal ABC transporter substrate-binding protein [Modicisalibacter sp. R2A 31.J]MBZ9575723.1 metal ABC transporter substrate-binding protein [Modicisalibacter sp. MOD 31.J]